VVGIAVDTAVDITVGTVADGGVESLGVNTSCAGRVGCSSTTTVAAATASVARTTPVRIIRRDHRFSSAGCSSASVTASSPLPADSSTSSGSNR
jgi:hypothetical protein